MGFRCFQISRRFLSSSSTHLPVITKMNDLMVADLTFSCGGDDVDIMTDFVVVMWFKR